MVGKLKVLLAILLCLPLMGAWPNTGRKYPSTAATYTGPGDIVSGSTAWWGLRAFNNTLANSGASTTAVMDVFGVTTVTGCTVYLKGDGTGNLDFTTSGPGGVGHQCASGTTTFCTVTNTSCTVSKLYDQSGSGVPALQATAANQPTLTFSGLGALPILTFSDTTVMDMASSANIAASAQPVTLDAVAKNTHSARQGEILSTNSAGPVALEFNSGSAANVVDIYCGTALNATAADNTWFSLAGVCNGGSSVMYVNGSGTSGAGGSNGISAVNVVLADYPGNPVLIGTLTEAGFWPSGFSSGAASMMSSNQRSYWGF